MSSDTVTQLTERFQRQATDPGASAWVSANAGTGKTYVLVRRVLRLLLSGSEPARILCLTFTKAAAAEMKNRLFQKMSEWATADSSRLTVDLVELLGRSPSQTEQDLARTLFAASLESPGGLKVQTIHAFCERLLQRFPLEAGLSPGFSVLDQEQTDALLRASIEAVLTEATSRAGPAQEALQTVIAHANEGQFDGLLIEAVKQRDSIREVLRRATTGDDPFAEIEARLRKHLGVPLGESADSLDTKCVGLISTTDAGAIHEALLTGSAMDVKAADLLSAVLIARSQRERIVALETYLLTKDGTPRAKPMTKAVATAHPELDSLIRRAADEALGLRHQRQGLAVASATAALLRLADAAIGHYADGKSRAAALDYDDLISKTANLLSSSGDTQWVLYKLDGGLDHILVDEAQDTGPLPWRIVTALADEFFANAGAGATLRTVFAVGDEKQSIYGFQGAAPEMFERTGRDFEALAKAAGTPYARVPLTLSFRTVAPVLSAVDAVFATAEAAAGLTASGEAVRHAVHRLGHAGTVEIWPTELPQEVVAEEPWSPIAGTGGSAPANRLAARIADTIAGWISRGERLASEDRPIRAGDVLILLRKRQPFAPAMIRALKARGLPVAGADRIRVTEQIAVEDLVALGRFLLLPEDDLALASALKSPLFGLDDDDLFHIGYARKGSLWGTLQRKAAGEPRLAEVAGTLKRWRSEADFLPPFEFFKRLLDKDGRRARLLTRLGPEAGDAIDEFLNLAIRFDTDEPPSLQGFLDWLGRASPEIKRDMDQGRNEIRIMTVHGAKGLEAPIVFLPDTCSVRGMRGAPLLPLAEGEPPVWLIKGATQLDAVNGAKTARADKDRHERNRLLYVAMTRARDQLYIGGFEGTRGREPGCWYDLILNALQPMCEVYPQADGPPLLRLQSPQTVPPKPVQSGPETAGALLPYPDWALRHAPRAEARTVPLAPSRLAPLDTEEGSGVAPPTEAVASPRGLATGNRFLRGTLTHALLQHLPSLAAKNRKAAAERFLKMRAPDLPAKVRTSIVGEVLAILDHPEFAPVFGPGSVAEVPVVAEIPLPDGQPVRIAGQIDRLFAQDGFVTIIDFKTNRPPPLDLASVPQTYLLQLAAYRLAIRRIYRTEIVRAALLWTDGARLMEVPADLLDDHEKALLSGRPWS